MEFLPWYKLPFCLGKCKTSRSKKVILAQHLSLFLGNQYDLTWENTQESAEQY